MKSALVISIMINVIAATLTYYGLHSNIEWALNITKFYIWSTFIMSIFAISSINSINANLIIETPKFLSHSFDTIMIIMLAAYGWFGYASLMLLSLIAMEMIYKKVKNNE